VVTRYPYLQTPHPIGVNLSFNGARPAGVDATGEVGLAATAEHVGELQRGELHDRTVGKSVVDT